MNTRRQNICCNNITGEHSVGDYCAEIIILMASLRILITAIRKGCKHSKVQQIIHEHGYTKLRLLNSSTCYSWDARRNVIFLKTLLHPILNLTLLTWRT
jgi:hypothetical protein